LSLFKAVGTQKQVQDVARGLSSDEPAVRQQSKHKLAEMGWGVTQLTSGSLCVMENACQMLYKHSLLPESFAGAPDGDNGPQNGGVRTSNVGVRINLTFRSKRPVELALAPFPRPLSSLSAISSSKPDLDCCTFVGLTSIEQHVRAQGWKDQLLHHAFETPFVDDPPAIAAARYQTWFIHQPAFAQWVCTQLCGRALNGAALDGTLLANSHGEVHAAALEGVVAALLGGTAPPGAPTSTMAHRSAL
jgi:hypothetical protein